MAKKQSDSNQNYNWDTQNPLYTEGGDGTNEEETGFTPSTSYVGGGYVGASDNAGENVGSYVGASYVGADRVVSAANRKNGNFRKTLLVSVIAIVALVALVAFVIWPLLIYPNMANADLYTPEILQSYCATSGDKDTILTFTDCSASGQVTATWEIINDGKYGKINLVGQITEKKNNGDLVIAWSSNTVEVMDSTMSWTNEMSASVSKNFTVVKTDAQELTAGVNDEYTIQSPADLQKLQGSDGTYYLKNDIDMSGVEWTPISDFSGMLIGNGYAIKNLTINSSSSNVGFFAILSGRVQNLKFENAQITVTGSQENVGILCGTLKGDATGITVSGKVIAKGASNVGGIIGYVLKNDNNLIMSNLVNKADVSGADRVGGILGRLNNTFGSSSASTQLSTFKNSGTITGRNNVGGVFGECYARNILTITDCSNTGAVTGAQNVGGVVGYAYGYEDNDGSYIANSSCAADISGGCFVGCIAGKLEGLLVNSCTNTGSTLTATKYMVTDGAKMACVGGFAGMANGANDCVNEVAINYTGGGSYVGGVIGYVYRNSNNVALSNLGNKADISGEDYVGGIFGRLNNQFGSSSASTQLSSFSNSGTVTGDDNVGGVIGECYARNILTMTDFANTGAVRGAQKVGGIVGFAYGYEDNDRSYIANSSCAAAITGECYVGCIAGKLDGLLVSSCTNTGSTLTATKYVVEDGTKAAYVGGFAGMANGANDCVNEVTINYTGGGSYVGGIIGYVYRNSSKVTLSNLENKADITGADHVGGIFGKLNNQFGSSSASTQLSTFKNSGAITGKNNVGGAIGECYARNILTITDFNNTGAVSGTQNVGGVVGYAYGYKNSAIQDSSTTSGALCGKLVDVTVK